MGLAWLPAAFALIGLTAASASAQSGIRTLTFDRTELGHLPIDGTGVETWVLDGAAGQIVGVTVRSEAFEPIVQIASPAGDELARDDDGGPITSREIDGARVVAHLRMTGRHLVRVATPGRGHGGAYEITTRGLEVNRIEPGVPVRARYEEADGADVWSFEGEAGQIIGIAVHADGFGPVVQLTSPRGQPLAREEDTRHMSASDSSAHLVAVLPVDGRYYIEVHDAYLYHSYAYRISVRRLAATPLTLNVPLGGGASFDDPADAYSFEGEAGQAVRVEISNPRWDCHLLPPVGERVPGACRGAVPLSVTGRYVLVLTPGPWWEDELDAELPPYELTVSRVPVSPLGVNAPVAGRLSDGGSDVWGFDGQADEVVSVALAAPRMLPLGRRSAFRLVAPSGEVLAQDSTSSESLQFVVQLPTDGRYLLEVRGDPRGLQAYRLTVRGGSETPRRLELDMPAIGIFDGVGPELDIWEFDGVAGQAVNVSVSSGSASFETRLEILSPCVFRSKPITDSGPNRSLIPVQTDHRFRSKPITLRRS